MAQYVKLRPKQITSLSRHTPPSRIDAQTALLCTRRLAHCKPQSAYRIVFQSGLIPLSAISFYKPLQDGSIKGMGFISTDIAYVHTKLRAMKWLILSLNLNLKFDAGRR